MTVRFPHPIYIRIKFLAQKYDRSFHAQVLHMLKRQLGKDETFRTLSRGGGDER